MTKEQQLLRLAKKLYKHAVESHKSWDMQAMLANPIVYPPEDYRAEIQMEKTLKEFNQFINKNYKKQTSVK